MTQASAAPIAFEQVAAANSIKLWTLATILLGSFAFDNLLLLHFWGVPLSLTLALAVVAAILIFKICGNFSDKLPSVPVQTLVGAFLISLALFALGGEGRFFYANPDWEIRDAVLRDLATNPWPYAYDIRGEAFFLRAPVGSYLLPAMFGGSAELAFLLSNAVRLALLMSLAWHGFGRLRDRAIALTTFLLFSGWDVLGTLFYSLLGSHPSWDHIEAWNPGSQYSSHITQAFWVPQHAIAGWTCAVMFMLWRRGMVPVGVLAASVPLVAIWSPLAIMGAIPFVVFAAIVTLRASALKRSDVAIALLALSVSLASLLYLQMDAQSVGIHVRAMHPGIWLCCIALEVLPFTWPLLRESGACRTDRPLVWSIGILLLMMPLVQIGVSVDFQMRASITPLALLSLLFAEWSCGLLDMRPVPRPAIAYALVAISLGAATPALEVRRALVNQISPPPLCSLVGVWNKQDGMIVPYASYLAPISKLPAELRRVPVTAGRSDPAKCWSRRWVVPSQS